MNTVFGFAGLLDTSSGVGLSLKPADFGQTLALAGVGSGPYLVFPVVGPTTMRDGFGFIVDRAFHPLTYVLAVPTQLLGYGGAGISRRDEAHDALKALDYGLLHKVAGDDGLMRAAQEEVDAIAKGGPIAITEAKRLVRTVSRLPVDEAYGYAEKKIAALFASEEAAEGMAAFAGKRPPRWAADDGEGGG